MQACDICAQPGATEETWVEINDAEFMLELCDECALTVEDQLDAPIPVDVMISMHSTQYARL